MQRLRVRAARERRLPSVQGLARVMNAMLKGFTPAEVETLLGDPTKAREKLGWTPAITFDEMVGEMVRADLKAARRDALVKGAGYATPSFRE